MTAVFHKILTVKAPDSDNPTKDIIKTLKQHPGIDCLILYHTKGLNQITVEFVCSDTNPSARRTQKDLENLKMHLGANVVKELSEHRNEPTKHTNHLLQISQKKSDEIETDETEEIERA